MTRNPRAFALVLLALLGSGALASSPASAHQFHSEVAPAILRGQQVASQTFEFSTGSKVTCPEISFQTTLNLTSVSELTFAPAYAKCVIGESPAPITMNGCNYRVSGKTDANEHGPVTVECEAGKYIQIDVGSVCTAKIRPQTPAKGAHFVNKGSGTGRDFELSMTLSEIEFEAGGGFSCTALMGNTKGLSLTGTSTVLGFEDFSGIPGKGRGVWVE